MAMIDMEDTYGIDVLSKEHIFQTGAAAIVLIQDYCFHQNRQCKVKRCSGGSKTYVCPQYGCPWEVHVTRRQRKGASSEHYISTLVDVHSDVCLATAKPLARQLELLPTFSAAVRGDTDIKRKAIVALVCVRDGTNLQNYRIKAYEVKEAVIEEMEGKWKLSYELLAPHLIELKRLNLSSTVALEVDQENRILRLLWPLECL